MNKYIDKIAKAYEAGEARAVFYRLMEDKYGLSRVELCLGAMNRLSEEQLSELDADVERLANGEPVQYVVGFEMFRGNRFDVRDGVLIPRVETEELVDWIVADIARNGCPDTNNADKESTHSKQILDIGCGSGAISVSLAKEGNDVTAWDVSDVALEVTSLNALHNKVTVNAVRQDALNAPDDTSKWDIIVSNPPYVCNREAEDMERNVLDYEPHLALFVPDDDPLLFYRAIAEYARKALRQGGALYYEINEHYGHETVEMLRSLGFTDIVLRKDQFGRDRMVRALLGSPSF